MAPLYRCGICLLIVVGRPVVAGEPNPFATRVIDYDPAPGQFVQDELFNDPARALGPPIGGGLTAADNTSVVTLGGFGGSITLGFDHTVLDDPRSPMGLDAIVFGNAFRAGSANRRWAECGVIEISRDDNGNGAADDAWFLIPGSHITDPPHQGSTATWDDNVADGTHPPANPTWIPPHRSGTWMTGAVTLPHIPFAAPLVINPNGASALDEGIHGYADYSPTLLLGDWNGDNVIEDPAAAPGEFYTIPDDPLVVGVSPGSGGGDAFDIAWAIDPVTLLPAGLDGFDFIRITNGVDFVDPFLGEKSPEIDAVADVSPLPPGDTDEDRDVDLLDYAALFDCQYDGGVLPDPVVCARVDFDGNQWIDVLDYAGFQSAFTGPM